MFKFPKSVDIVSDFGVVLIFAGILGFVTVLFELVNKSDQTIDYYEIYEKGVSLNAVITDVEVKPSKTMNKYPTVVSYNYFVDDSVERSSKYEVLESADKLDSLFVGQEIVILEFDGHSAISGLKPNDFPGEIVVLVLMLFIVVVGLIVRFLTKVYFS